MISKINKLFFSLPLAKKISLIFDECISANRNL